MSTIVKKPVDPTPLPSTINSLGEEQLRRDRWTGAIAVAIAIAMIGLTIWLASMGEPADYNEMDYWHMLP